jgi:hypothetical protein
MKQLTRRIETIFADFRHGRPWESALCSLYEAAEEHGAAIRVEIRGKKFDFLFAASPCAEVFVIAFD